MNGTRGHGLAARLLVAQLFVVGIAVATAGAVAAVVGPSIFRNHLGKVTHTGTPQQAAAHAEQAFRAADVISLAVALCIAFGAAVAVSAYVTRRIAAPVAALAAAASQVASGYYDVRMTAPALGVEFDTLTASFTAMAERLHDVEVTRRRLLADLAHEMRTPVATLGGYLEGLEDGVVALDPETATMLSGQTRRLARLCDDIAAVSRAEEHQLDLSLAPISVTALIAGVVSTAGQRYAERGVRLTTATIGALPDLRVDADRLGQVLGNLLDNALRHTPSGGAVDVRASLDGSQVVIEVSDTGVGIPAEHLPHVFERFYRVDEARDREQGGSGIGLAIARALVEAHGGRISATSGGPGTGTTFSVRLPVGGRSAPRV